MKEYNKAKVFSATRARDRHTLGERITEYLRDHQYEQVVEYIVRQSSDHEYHCITIILLLQT